MKCFLHFNTEWNKKRTNGGLRLEYNHRWYKVSPSQVLCDRMKIINESTVTNNEQTGTIMNQLVL